MPTSTKHVSFIFGSLIASFDEDKGGTMLQAFKYKGTHYKEKWLENLLEESNKDHRLVGAIGLGLNVL